MAQKISSIEEKCADEVFASIYPKVICLRNLDSEKIVREHQLALYALLPTTKRPEVHLLEQALKEMHEYYDHEQFISRITWFTCLMDRTKTMFNEEKHIIQEVLQMQYQIDSLLRESPTIMAILADDVAEAKAEGLAEGLREAILDIVSDRFPELIVSQVQQTIAPTQNVEQLRNFHRKLARVSDEQEVPALLAQCFPADGETKSRIEGIQESILDVVSVRFSSQVAARVQHTIAPVQDIQQLRKFLRQLACLSDEEEVYASLAQCFPTH